MKKQILNFGKALNKAAQKEINGGQVPNECFNNTPAYEATCREIALADYMSGGCPTWNHCFSSGPTGCTDMCMHETGGQ